MSLIRKWLTDTAHRTSTELWSSRTRRGICRIRTEKDKRYKLIREKMVSQALDALIVISSAQINEKGFVRYLTNYRHILYNLVVILPRSGDARLLVPSPVQKYWAGLLSWIPNVEEQIPSLSEAISRNIKDMGLSKGRLGLINTKIMPAKTYLAPSMTFLEQPWLTRLP